ncbi:MAG: PilZ domain-containing protein [Sphingomicrobium sp.]
MNSFRSALDKGDGLHPSGPTMPAKKPSGANEEMGLGSIPVAREAVRNVNHRDDDRHRLQAEQAIIRIGRKSHDVELINLSGGGAMIRTDVPVEMWQKLFVVLGDCNPVEAAVRWIRGDRIGLEFAHETQIGGDETKRNAMLLEVLKRSFPETAKTRLAPKTAQKISEVPCPKEIRTGEQRRENLRHPLIWWGEIHFSHESTRVRLRNISESGALVDSDVAFPPDAEVLLDLGGAGQHFATVSWSRGDQVGLRFASPFDVALLAKVKPELATHKWTRPSYLSRGNSAHAGPSIGWDSSTLPELRDDLEGFLKR